MLGCVYVSMSFVFVDLASQSTLYLYHSPQGQKYVEQLECLRLREAPKRFSVRTLYVFRLACFFRWGWLPTLRTHAISLSGNHLLSFRHGRLGVSPCSVSVVGESGGRKTAQPHCSAVDPSFLFPLISFSLTFLLFLLTFLRLPRAQSSRCQRGSSPAPSTTAPGPRTISTRPWNC